MGKVNYHTHTTGSDGELEPEESVKLAIEKGFDVWGITDHYGTPPGFDVWGQGYYTDEHYAELRRLQKKYKDKIKILVGVEFDWLEDYKDWTCEKAKRDYDYRLVSVHFLKIGGKYIQYEYNEKIFIDAVKKVGGIRKLVEIYYSELRDAVEAGCFDVVAHMDLIKLWNKDSKYFSEDEDWYRDEVFETLKVIKKAGMKIDLNTKGFRRPCDEQCPSLWVVEEAKKMGIEFLVGTDCHRVGDMEAGLGKMEEMI